MDDDERLGYQCIVAFEALRLATSVISRRYVLPETMQHPQARLDCMWLAYLIQAYGLGLPRSALQGVKVGRRTLRSE
jgi:hypothetical protein